MRKISIVVVQKYIISSFDLIYVCELPKQLKRLRDFLYWLFFMRCYSLQIYKIP